MFGNIPLTRIRDEIKVICLPNNLQYVAPEDGNDAVTSLSYYLKQGELTFDFLFRLFCMHHRVQSDGGSLHKNIFPMSCWDNIPPYIDIDMSIAVMMVNNVYIKNDDFQDINSWQVYKYFYSILCIYVMILNFSICIYRILVSLQI